MPVAAIFLVLLVSSQSKYRQVFSAAELFTYAGFSEQNKVRVFFANPWPNAVVLLLLSWTLELSENSNPGPVKSGLWSGAQTRLLLGLLGELCASRMEKVMGSQAAWPRPSWGQRWTPGCCLVPSWPFCLPGDSLLSPGAWLKPPHLGSLRGNSCLGEALRPLQELA